MGRLRFNFTSDQLELLLAFEESNGLNTLAEAMAKDPSVVSRGLQRIAEVHPVLEKIRGRWEITALGKQVNQLTKEFLKNQETLLSHSKPQRPPEIPLNSSTVLLVINAQAGLLDATQGGRNNSDAEKNIHSLIQFWRKRNLPVVHVKHISENPTSLFYRHSPGSEFLPEAYPQDHEDVVEKTKSSAFTDTVLSMKLKDIEASNLVLTGFTASECIDATAKDAAALGFSTFVVGDATAMFDLRSPEGKLLKADRVHRLTLANLHAFYAKVLNTADIISSK